MRSRLPLLLTVATLIVGCGSGPRSAGAGGVQVIAVENFWGSIAAQLAGNRARVQSIIVNPAQDPHAYQPTAADARALAASRLAVVNGVGYDPWALQLLAANPSASRITINVGDLSGLHEGDNPHRWYDPQEVKLVASAIEADLRRLDTHDAAYFAARLKRFDRIDLEPYHALIAAIRRRYGGVTVGASESIFALLAPDLGLTLRTPERFMKAIAEGTEVTAQDTLSAQRQLARHEIKVWVYNAQNVTPQIEALNAMARATRIPTVSITETLSPADVSFEQWQVAQLRELAAALHEATGR